MTKPQCSKRVSDASGFHFRNCSRAGKMQRDGKWYCNQHDPVRVRERKEAQQAAYDRDSRARIIRYKFEADCLNSIRQTAKRLGVDPVAFAEACADGYWLAAAIENSLGLLPSYADRLAALKRAEPEA